MKFGLIPVNIGVQSTEQMIGLAQLAESRDFESVWTFEHVIIPMDYQSKYPYNESGKMGADPEANLIDPLIALAAIASQTTTLRLGTGVNILSQVNPLYMAKQAASLDMISNGRFMLGVGIGWLREEFEALGVPYEKRGARFDDYVTAIRKVWSGDVVEHQSEFVSWSNFKSYPIPVQNPMPVVMGGIKGKIHERIAKHGNGWFAPTTDISELTGHMDKIKTCCDSIDRDFAEIEITCMWPGFGGKEAVQGLADAGVHRLVVPLMALGEDPVAGINKLADDVIA
ncbi:MAG: LLM class F420-dependent oxidoreductase [bacterium]|nr:LLM class F420-dependent oxidoreductase [Gammaproteobacteria bacterium]